MTGLVGQAIVCAVLVAAALVSWTLVERSQPTVVEAGLWFEPVTFRSARLGGASHGRRSRGDRARRAGRGG